MGLLKKFLAGDGEGPDTGPDTPEQSQRSAAEEALDRMIAARAAEAAPRAGNTPAQPAGRPALAGVNERRATPERGQHGEDFADASPDRREGNDLRANRSDAARPAGFGRRTSRPG